MPYDIFDLALARARASTLSVELQSEEEGGPGQFMDRLLPLSDRVGSLTMDHHSVGSDVTAPLWTSLPNIQNLRLVHVDDFPHEELDGSSQTMHIPSPRWIYLYSSTLPTVPTLYSQVEELVLEHPSEALTISDLKLIAESTPKLRTLRFDEIRLPDTESLNDPSSPAPMPMPNLQLLHIARTYRDSAGWLLERFQLSPRTSIRIECWDGNISPYQIQIRDQIWTALRSTAESSFSLELAPWAYRFQTRNVSIEIEVLYPDEFTRWPDFLTVSRLGLDKDRFAYTSSSKANRSIQAVLVTFRTKIASRDYRSVQGRQDYMETLVAVIHYLQYNYNRLLPIDGLPDEILLNIFKLVMEKFSTFDEYRDASNFCEKLKSYHAALYPLRAVCRRWCEIVVSYGPFWSVFDSRMPEKQIELGLSRSGNAPLTVGVFKRPSNSANRFIERMAPLSTRFSHLILDLVDTEVGYVSALWVESAPNLQQLSIRGANVNIFPTSESCFKGTTSSLRRLYLNGTSILPTAQTLYERLEEFTIDSPSQALTVSTLDSVLRGASKLRILRFRLILMPIMAPTGTFSGRISIPSLLALSFEMVDSLVISQLLGLIRLSPRTSLRVVCVDMQFSSFEAYIRRHIRAVLHSMKEKSFRLNMSPNTYLLRTYYVCISLQVPAGGLGRRLWPNYFANFSPPDGQAPIRVNLFLRTGARPINFPTHSLYRDCRMISLF
ncbi:hypothetical protein FS837_003072 [Tulasnella sp. UAMH 9824]|nr:hypothetical protein FS837_003072 [Tulasnella sp. UAMH 9824]